MSKIAVNVPKLSANPQVRVNCVGWFVVEYPNNQSAVLVFRSIAEKSKFLKDCGVDSIDQVQEIPQFYYDRAIKKRAVVR